jgi:TatA/E family protein of Tat protein translocase
MNLGPMEIIIVLLLALLLFGAKRLPELGRGLGNGIREFRKSAKDLRGDLDGSFDDEPAPATQRVPGKP